MLLLWDRNFLSYQTVSEVLQLISHLLSHIKSNLIFKPIRVLYYFSYFSNIYPLPAYLEKYRNCILLQII